MNAKMHTCCIAACFMWPETYMAQTHARGCLAILQGSLSRWALLPDSGYWAQLAACRMVTCLYIVPLMPSHESLESIDVFGLQQRHRLRRPVSQLSSSVAQQVE